MPNYSRSAKTKRGEGAPALEGRDDEGTRDAELRKQSEENAHRRLRNATCLTTSSSFSATVNLCGVMPIGNAATRMSVPFSSTPYGVPSRPRMRVHDEMKWRA